MDTNVIPEVTDVAEESSNASLTSKESYVSAVPVMLEKLRKLMISPLDDLERSVYKEPEWKKRCKKRTLIRFKLLHTLLKGDIEDKETLLDKELQDVAVFATADGTPVFNVNAFKRIFKSIELDPKVKCILTKPTYFRTSEETELVEQNLHELPLFQRYSAEMHQELAQSLYYQNIPKGGRIIIKEGQKPVSFYFIVTGILTVYITTKDKDTGIERIRILNEMKAGGSFGELALIHKTRRLASVKTKDPTELLFIYKDDFDALLRSNAKNIWLHRFQLLRNLKYFSTWTSEELIECCNSSKTMRFEDKQVIVSNVEGVTTGHLYIILEGKCKILETLRIIRGPTRLPFHQLIMPPVRLESEIITNIVKSKTKVKKRFLQILTLEIGQYFGAGEDLRGRSVVALGKLEVICISHRYLRLSNHLDWLKLLHDNIEAFLPSHASVFQEFIEKAKWRAYKQSMLDNVVQRTPSCRTRRATIEDVPFSVRTIEASRNWSNL